MLKRIMFTVITLVVAGVCSADLHAQTLQTGIWTGTAVGPDGSSEDVTFRVEQKPVWITPPVWSPDGARVVFSRRGATGTLLQIGHLCAIDIGHHHPSIISALSCAMPCHTPM